MPPLRVAIFTESFLPYLSGVTVSVDALARGLGRAGHRALVVAPRPPTDETPAGASPGPDPDYAWVASYELPAVAPRGYRMPSPLAWRAPWRAVERFDPDLIHAHSPFVSGLAARAAARRLRVPLVFTHHTRFGQYRHYLGPLGPVGARLLDAYLERFRRGCAGIIAPSAGLAAEIGAAVAAPRPPGGRARRDADRARGRPLVRGIPTGIDVAAVAALAPVDPRPRFGWPPDSVVAVSLGRLAPEKNVEVLLEAFAGAACEAPRLRLLLVGTGSAEEQVRARAEEHDLRGRVGLTGLMPRPDALALLRCCDLFLFASLTETQGIVLAEALACGLPVVALDGPGVRETVSAAEDGVVVTADDDTHGAVALGAAAAALAHDDRRRSALAAAARLGAERFGLEAYVERVVELYREVAR